MFLIGNLLNAIAGVLDIVLHVYIWVIIVRVLISWVNPDPGNPIVQILYRVTDPVLEPVRRRLPDMGGLDISPVVVLLAIFVVQKFLVASLFDMARILR
ncbi:MAG: YggT family protein [Nitrospinota bacterium]